LNSNHSPGSAAQWSQIGANMGMFALLNLIELGQLSRECGQNVGKPRDQGFCCISFSRSSNTEDLVVVFPEPPPTQKKSLDRT
jgi:hypothetical protein